ncbi:MULTISPECIES: hypothetical protein [unclassified Crossiella]|uniref:hypothetical protein n=1 Tax=unclassified Crossiella TaxID=2620835 RepID=UPI001FFE5B57|nr:MULTISPECIES: hypothetical protein [unclassified Crossiella]MCK2236448.1 hypothetical protein [Crossiella sp. S99.2]MCK2250115.1 hypothetical protein [Crossiella sp. S99.1]
MRHYGIDLLDHYRGQVSRRRLRVLIQHLPRDGALARELRGEAADWGLGEQLLAAAVDQLAAANWMYAAAHTAEGADPPERPLPVPRPGIEQTPEPAGASPAQIAAFFGAPLPQGGQR